MTPAELADLMSRKKSRLCIGLDTDPQRIPAHLHKYRDPVWEFNREIIRQTRDLAVAYKINTAFYEARGAAGWRLLGTTRLALPDDVLAIADAKRGDIGNTTDHYARTFLDLLNFDAVTVAPYMGRDSISPFLTHKDKWTFLLALTSNPGAADFQMLESDGKPLYQHVIERARQWPRNGNLGFVVGATRPEHFDTLRQVVGDHFMLVPGIGAQGGNLQLVARLGNNVLINASRSIIYASGGEDFGDAARAQAEALARATWQFRSVG